MSQEPDRIYTINLGKVLLSPDNQRAKRAINMIKEFTRHHMKTQDIKIDDDVAHHVWSRGMRSPPRKIKVRMTKPKGGFILVSRYDGAAKPADPEPAPSGDGTSKETTDAATETADEIPKYAELAEPAEETPKDAELEAPADETSKKTTEVATEPADETSKKTTEVATEPADETPKEATEPADETPKEATEPADETPKETTEVATEPADETPKETTEVSTEPAEETPKEAENNNNNNAAEPESAKDGRKSE